MTRGNWLTLSAAVLLWGLMPGVGSAQTESADPAAAQCKALERADFSGVTDAATQITSAVFAPAAKSVPAHCNVQGYVATNVGIQVLLPATNWNGKFLKHGCGGFCGVLLASACEVPLQKGYACVVSDMGHKSTTLDAKWAYNNLQAEVDFGFRSTHVSTLAGKAIAEKYFGKPASRTYYMGCSTGGRQGMVAAQRFPYDYDAIIAGAPVIDETGDGMDLLWSVMATLGKDGKSILSPDDLRGVNQAALATCDMDDGVKDGVIGDPRTCSFDPAELQCKAGKKSGCLSKDQADAVRKIYNGPVNAKGQKIYTGGALPGSELNWINNYVSADGGPSIYHNFMADLFRYMGFMPDPGPGWTASQFDFDKDYKRIGMMESLYSGSNPDLRKFKANGGKLLVYQGWADQSVVPLNIIDYYETAVKTMGGRHATEEFFRLFMVPGMNHCTGGAGAYAIDYLTAMEEWVERGRAPDTLVSVHPKAEAGFPVRFPIDPANAEFSRPVYPYPLQPKYNGSGDPAKIENFTPAVPSARDPSLK